MAERHFLSKTVDCPKGHRLKLEMRSGTKTMVRAIKCPVCGTGMIVVAGDVLGVVPVEDDSE